jgi:biopolymer transport protein ExbB/TolQ
MEDDVIRSNSAACTGPENRLRWKVGAWIGGILCAGPLLGLFGTVLGMIQSSRAIELERAPTPEDVAVGVRISMIATTAGLVLGCIGAALLAVSLLQLTRTRRSEGDSSATASPV